MLLKFVAWLGQKLIAAALIVLIALAGYGLWLFLQEEGVFEERRMEKMQRAIAERDHLLAAQDAITRRISGIRAEIETQKENAKKADRIIATLRELESWWDRWFGNRQQQSANAEQLQRMEKLRGETTGKITELQRVVTQAIWEKDGVDIHLRRANAEVENLETSRSRTRHFVVIAWEKTKW